MEEENPSKNSELNFEEEDDIQPIIVGDDYGISMKTEQERR